jgi:hypothetical protein
MMLFVHDDALQELFDVFIVNPADAKVIKFNGFFFALDIHRKLLFQRRRIGEHARVGTPPAPVLRRAERAEFGISPKEISSSANSSRWCISQMKLPSVFLRPRESMVSR